MVEQRAVIANGKEIDVTQYWAMHEYRFQHTISKLVKHASGRVLEIGGHPWAMSSLIADAPGLELAATVSAEEITKWPDDIGLTSHRCELQSMDNNHVSFQNYSLNVERHLVDIGDKFDAIVACEVMEHLVRAPHIMLLNMNRWLRDRGTILVTTPNGAQFSNPLRNKSRCPPLRCYAYERHNTLYTLSQLQDLVRRSGFKIRESGYWDLYQRQGLSRMYGLARYIPGRYFKAKFSRTIYAIAEKTEDRDCLDGYPSVYVRHPDWEHISPETSKDASG